MINQEELLLETEILKQILKYCSIMFFGSKFDLKNYNYSKYSKMFLNNNNKFII